MRYVNWLFGAILVATALCSAAANAADCPIESGMFGYDTSVKIDSEHALVKGSTFKDGSQTYVRLLDVGAKIYNAYAADCKQIDGKVRDGWGSTLEFGNKFVALHGATAEITDLEKRLHDQHGLTLPGFDRKAAAPAHKPVLRTCALCAYVRDGKSM